MDANEKPAPLPEGGIVADAASAGSGPASSRRARRAPGSGSPRRRRGAAVLGAATLFVATASGCSDDAGPPEPAPGTTMPFVDGTLEPLDSTGGPGGAVLNNQPTSPAANNAPPGDDGTG
jgi:hypothetical protein